VSDGQGKAARTIEEGRRLALSGITAPDMANALSRALFAAKSAAYTGAYMRGTSNLSGVAAMLAGTGSFVVCDSFMKLATADLPPFEVLFLRGVAASFACGLLVVLLGDGRVMVMAAAAAMSLGFESWRAPTGRHLAYLGFAGLLVTFGHVGLLLAFRLGRTAAVAPFFYSFALWAVLPGLFVFGALPNALALAGIALIAGSGVAIVLIDQRRGEEIALREAL
jgi:drug/metabolite transporter (DMT)-like permease